MATITANISASATTWPVSAEVAPGWYTVDSENVQVTNAGYGHSEFVDSFYASVDRGVAGTTAASHASGATLTRYYPDAATAGGGGGVTVDNGVDPPAAVATIVAPGAVVAGDTATLPTVVESETDPGAIGVGNLWLRVLANGRVVGLFVRNATDDDWLRAAFGTAAMDAPADAYPIIAALYDTDGSTLAASVEMGSGGPTWGSVRLAAFKRDANNYEGTIVQIGVTAESSIELIAQNTANGALIAGITLNASGLSLPGLPTTNPGAGLIWSDAGTLKVGT